MMRGDTEIISEINHVFSPGSVTVLLGFSGSGKSTLLKLAAGLLTPSSGIVRVNEKSFFQLRRGEEEAFRKNSGFIFQDAALWANQTVFENVAFPLKVHFPHISGDKLSGKVLETMAEVGYRDKPERRPSQISGGEQKMIGIARAIVSHPKLLFIDMPLLNLDSASEARVLELLKRLKIEGTSMIISSGSSHLISLLADYLLIIDRGKIVESGPFNVVKRSSHPVTKGVLASVLEHVSSYDDDILNLLEDV